mgnify:CR=1 FL=1
MINQVKVFLSVALMTISIYVQAEQASAKLLPNDSENLITIPAHSRSAEVNAKHAAECAAMGGVDITDENITKVGVGVDDTLSCRITNEQKYSEYSSKNNLMKSNNIKSQQNIKQQLSATYTSATVVSAIAPNGYFANSPYVTEGVGIFNGNGVGGLAEIDVQVPNDLDTGINGYRCITFRWANIYKDDVNAKIVLSFTCRIYSYGVQPSKTTALVLQSYNGPTLGYAIDRGTIIHPNAPGTVDISKNKGNDNSPNCALPSSWQGNPINVAIGNKFQQEEDIKGSGSYPLNFVRTYNSADGYWRDNYSDHLTFNGIQISLVRADGKTSYFYQSGAIISKTPTELGTLTQNGTNWRYKSPFNEIFDFDASGRLVKTTNPNGLVHNISYSPIESMTMTISDSFKHTITLTQDNNYQPLKLTTKDGQTIIYGYDSLNRLTTVTKNGKTRTYHYEDAAFPRALTGITDERGIRYATWKYDSAGRAIQSSHAGNVDTVNINYNSDGSATVTNPLGRTSKFSFTTIDGIKRVSSISGSATASCPLSNASFEYNTQGLLTLQTDSRGIKTSYQYNDLGEEISRTLGVDTPEAQTTTTTWDPNLNLPKTVTRANQSITYSYDAQGRLTGKTIQSLN